MFVYHLLLRIGHILRRDKYLSTGYNSRLWLACFLWIQLPLNAQLVLTKSRMQKKYLQLMIHFRFDPAISREIIFTLFCTKKLRGDKRVSANLTTIIIFEEIPHPISPTSRRQVTYSERKEGRGNLTKKTKNRSKTLFTPLLLCNALCHLIIWLPLFCYFTFYSPVYLYDDGKKFDLI